MPIKAEREYRDMTIRALPGDNVEEEENKDERRPRGNRRPRRPVSKN